MNGLLRFDEDTFRLVHVGLHRAWLDPVFWAFSYSGLGQVQALFALALLFSKKTRHWTLPLLLTILISGVPIADGFKKLISRDRPSNLLIAHPQEAFYANSFPSGHTTTSFAVATMLFLLTYRTEKAWAGWLAVVWAFLVGVSRIYRGVHWPTDALAGLCAGVFTSCLLYLILDRFGRLSPPVSEGSRTALRP